MLVPVSAAVSTSLDDLNPPPTCRAVSIQPSGPLGLRVKGWRSIAGAGLAGDSPRTVPLDSSEAVLPLSPGYSRVGVGLAGVFDRYDLVLNVSQRGPSPVEESVSGS